MTFDLPPTPSIGRGVRVRGLMFEVSLWVDEFISLFIDEFVKYCLL